MMGGASISRQGFSLLEISIALTIIGLLAGGILLGQSLIHVSEIRATIKQIEQYNIAVNAFQAKYNCLPGDCRNASDLGFDATSNGDGNGLIGLCNYSTACRWGGFFTQEHRYESIDFWYHLAEAGLIPEKFTPGHAVDVAGESTPKIKLTNRFITGRGGWGVQSDVEFESDFGGDAFLPHSFASSSTYSTPSMPNLGLFVPADIHAIDVKIDDGLPTAGMMRAFTVAWPRYAEDSKTFFGCKIFSSTTFCPGPGGPNSTVCIRTDTTPYEYNVVWDGAEYGSFCGMVVKAAF